MRRRIANLIGKWFGCGLSPAGPGTAGSLGAIAIGLIAHHWFSFRPQWFLLWAAVLLVPGIWAAGEVAKLLAKEDPVCVVVDEVVGQWVTLAGALTLNWKSWLAAFVLFRLFDIWKPWPVHKLESLPGGTGIVADDVMAGIYGALVLAVAGCFNLY